MLLPVFADFSLDIAMHFPKVCEHGKTLGSPLWDNSSLANALGSRNLSPPGCCCFSWPNVRGSSHAARRLWTLHRRNCFACTKDCGNGRAGPLLERLPRSVWTPECQCHLKSKKMAATIRIILRSGT